LHPSCASLPRSCVSRVKNSNAAAVYAALTAAVRSHGDLDGATFASLSFEPLKEGLAALAEGDPLLAIADPLERACAALNQRPALAAKCAAAARPATGGDAATRASNRADGRQLRAQQEAAAAAAPAGGEKAARADAAADAPAAARSIANGIARGLANGE